MKYRISHTKQLVKHQYYYTRYHYVNETEFEMFSEKQTPHACMSYFIFLMQMIFSHVISAVNEAFSYKTRCFIFRAVLAESSRNHQCRCETEAPVQNSSSFISFFSKMRVPILLVFFPCLIFVKAQVPPPNVHLEKISTLYVPSRYNSHDYPEFKLGKHAAEQLAYDPAQKILYVTGKIISL